LYYKDLGFQKKVEIHGNRVFGGDSLLRNSTAKDTKKESTLLPSTVKISKFEEI
jgi:hypothetical protein